MKKTPRGLRKIVERRRDEYLWGQRHRIVPRLVSKVFGNGRRMIELTPINTRPNFFVVLIDPSWQLDNRSDGELFIDHLDEVIEAIGEEYGYLPDDDCEAGEYPDFPIVDWGVGCSWGEIDVAYLRARKW